MKLEASDEQPGNTAKDRLAVLEKEEQIREKRKSEEKERQAKIASINKAANIVQQRDFAELKAKIDFSQDPTTVANKAREVLAELPAIPVEDDGLTSVYYEKETGRGYARKSFKFKRDKDSYKVFPAMHKNIGAPVTSDHIKELISFTGAGFSERVNRIAKAMRRSTGLTKDEIVLNGGSLTLIGKKLETPPA